VILAVLTAAAAEPLGSGTNAVRELLRSVAPAAVPGWAIALAAALIGVGIAVAIVSVVAVFIV